MCYNSHWCEIEMSKYHPNTKVLLKLEKEANRLGWNEKYPDKIDFCYEVAKKAGELGNKYPSNRAIGIAEDMLGELIKKESD